MSEQKVDVAAWQGSMRTAFRSLESLLEFLNIPSASIPAAVQEGLESGFPLFVTREFASRMEKGNLHDPLLAQVLPRQEEAQQAEGFLMDPVGDGAAEVVPGLLHKYHGRALMIATGACAVHCRYCFRRHYPYQDAPKSIAQFEPAFDYLRSDHSIHEIILSGGDPLTLVDSKLGQLVEQFEKIDSLQRLRIHTRLPIMIPQRVSRELLELIERSRLATWIVLHSNHARELDDQVAASILRLRQAGVVMLNQAVLLRGVNDSVEAQEELSLRLVDMGVVPYYLHHWIWSKERPISRYRLKRGDRSWVISQNAFPDSQCRNTLPSMLARHISSCCRSMPIIKSKSETPRSCRLTKTTILTNIGFSKCKSVRQTSEKCGAKAGNPD